MERKLHIWMMSIIKAKIIPGNPIKEAANMKKKRTIRMLLLISLEGTIKEAMAVKAITTIITLETNPDFTTASQLRVHQQHRWFD